MIRFLSLLVGLFLFLSAAADAQERVWVQVEANPTLGETEVSIRRYAAVIENVNGVRLRSGWYAIALGPFTEEVASEELRRLLPPRLDRHPLRLAPACQLGLRLAHPHGLLHDGRGRTAPLRLSPPSGAAKPTML